MTVGVLALQGDFHEHMAILRRIGIQPLEVRLPKHLEMVDRLIIPGGESTTIGRLMTLYQLVTPIRVRAGRDLALWGTCAGAILLASTVLDMKQGGQPGLALMDIVVRRNAYGSQLDSFEQPIKVPVLGDDPLLGIFIRAPQIESVGPAVRTLAHLSSGAIVAAQQGRMLATTFHPELTDDDRVHRYFLEL